MTSVISQGKGVAVEFKNKLLIAIALTIGFVIAATTGYKLVELVFHSVRF